VSVWVGVGAFAAARHLSCWRDPRWDDAEDWRVGTAAGFQTPAMVCPRGCYDELARRELVTRTSLFGSALVRVKFAFETETCPTCGSRLVGECGRCEQRVLAPVSDRCRFCGLPQPWSPERRSTARRTRSRPWRFDARDPAVLVHAAPGRGELLIVEGDVTSVAVDAVVSNDDVDGRMYTVIASSIKAVAGPDVERQSIAQGPFPLGEAWYTDAGALPAPIRGIIHVAAMDRRGGSDSGTLVRCALAALEEARRQRLTSLAIAAFGTGPRGRQQKLIDLDDWLAAVGEAIVHEFASWDVVPGRAPLSVLFVLYDPPRFEESAKRLWSAASAAAAALPGVRAHAPPVFGELA